MHCSVCSYELSARAKFCPLCGARAAVESKPSAAAYSNNQGPTVIHRREELTGMIGLATREIRKIDAPKEMPPVRDDDLRPALADLFRHKEEMRYMLEVLVANWPAGEKSVVVECAREFLETHCSICGQKSGHGKKSTKPLCLSCGALHSFAKA